MKNKYFKKLVSITFIFFLLTGFFLLATFIYTSIESVLVKKLDSKILEHKELGQKSLKLAQDYKEWIDIGQTYRKVKQKYFYRFEKFSTFKSDFDQSLSKLFIKVLKKNTEINNIDNKFAMLKISLILEGSYKNIKKFLYQTKNNKKVINFKSINLSKKGLICYGEITLEVCFVR